jgi:acyl-coenzyme A synthetase/AMP-(fatty) acid ligase
LEAAVVGVPDEVRGHIPKAFVVRRQGVEITVEALRRHVAERLSPTCVPREIIFRTMLPKSIAGKVMKNRLETAD